MVKLTQRLVTQDIINKRSYGKGNPVTSITVHQTGNRDRGANADMHARLQSRLNPRLASWHYQVDDKEAIQSFPDNVMCWAATDGRGPGNTTSIHIEICVNSDGNYKRAIQNGAKLVQLKMKEHNLKTTDIKRHFDWSRKFCPEQLMRGHEGITWDDFLNMVEDVAKAPRPASVLYRVRKSWNDPKSQKGAYAQLANAHEMASKHKGYSVYDEKGNVIADSANELYRVRKSWGNTASQKGAYRGLENAKAMADKHSNHKVYNEAGVVVYENKAKLKVDGRFGPATIRALQTYYGTTVDGVISKPSLVVMKLQATLGVTQDGYMGSETITALQKRMGTTQDGRLSDPSLVIMELQKRLNKGKL